MTSGRKPLAMPTITEPEADMARAGEGFERMRDQQLGAIARGVEAEQHVRAVARQVGYQLPADCIDPDLIQRDISANMRRASSSDAAVVTIVISIPRILSTLS